MLVCNFILRILDIVNANVFQNCLYVLMALNTSGLLKIQSLTLLKQALQRTVEISFPLSKKFYTLNDLYMIIVGQAIFNLCNLYNKVGTILSYWNNEGTVERELNPG